MSREYLATSREEAVGLIRRGLEEARSSKMFVMITGPVGMDRNKLAYQAADRKAREVMVSVEAYESIRPRGLIGAICRALGEADKGTLDQALSRVIASLVEKPKLLVIDEANYLPVQSLNQLVHINNRAKVGIVLMGTDDLYFVIERPIVERVRSRLKQTICLDEYMMQEAEAGPEPEPEGRGKKVLKFGKRASKAGSGR